MIIRRTVIQSGDEIIEISHKETLKAARFEIVVDEIKKSGNCYPYSYVNIKSGVVILPMVNESICAIKQFRPTIGDWIYELPAGAIEKDEKPIDAAIRELYEEVGCKVLNIYSLGDTYASTGCTNEHVYLFAAECIETAFDDRDASEIIEKILIPKDEFEEIVRKGSLKCATNELAWHRYLESGYERDV